MHVQIFCTVQMLQHHLYFLYATRSLYDSPLAYWEFRQKGAVLLVSVWPWVLSIVISCVNVNSFCVCVRSYKNISLLSPSSVVRVNNAHGPPTATLSPPPHLLSSSSHLVILRSQFFLCGTAGRHQLQFVWASCSLEWTGVNCHQPSSLGGHICVTEQLNEHRC